MFIKFSSLNLKANRMKRQRNLQHFDTLKKKDTKFTKKKIAFSLVVIDHKLILG